MLKQEPMMKLTVMPPEIIVQIISFLPTKDIVNRASLVSKQFHMLSKESFVAISVLLMPDSTPEKAMQIFAHRSSQIRDLTLDNISEETQKVLTNQIGSLKNLHTCKVVRNINQTYTFPKKFLTQLFQLKHLKDLELRGYFFEEASLNTIGECQHLKRLFVNLSDYNVSNHEFQLIANFREIKFLWINLETNFEAEVSELPIEPLHLDKQLLMDHCYFLSVQNFSPSHLRMIASKMPNLRALAFKCELAVAEIDTPEFNSALRHLIQRCKRLGVICFMNCTTNDFESLKKTFSDWNVWKGRHLEFTLGMNKSYLDLEIDINSMLIE